MNNMLIAMDAAAAARIPVVAIQHTARSESAPVFRYGSREWSLHEEIARRPFDVLIEKTRPDSFSETGLQDRLVGHGIDTLAVCGYRTHRCCDTTARRAFRLGYMVELLANATGTLALRNTAGAVSDEVLHRSILAVQHRFSRVMTTEAWINRIQAQATHGPTGRERRHRHAASDGA